MSLPTDAKERKNVPMARGLLDYFPDALAAVADVSRVGNEQHNPGQPIHWARHLSTDHADCLLRHLVDRGIRDSDGLRHSAKVAWRALAMLQMELEAEEHGVTVEQYIERLKRAAAEPSLHEANAIIRRANAIADEFDVVGDQPCTCPTPCLVDGRGLAFGYYCRKTHPTTSNGRR